MTLILIFLLLCIIEISIIWFKWKEISDFVSVGKFASKMVGVEEQYTGFINKIAIFFIKRKGYAWVPTLVLLFANLIAATFIIFIIWLLQLILILVQ